MLNGKTPEERKANRELAFQVSIVFALILIITFFIDRTKPNLDHLSEKSVTAFESKNIEKQLTRIADSLEFITSNARRIEFYVEYPHQDCKKDK